MMDIYMMQYNFRSGYLVVINEKTHVSVYKNEKYKFGQPFLAFLSKNIFIGKSKVCSMTDFSGALNNSIFDGNTILLDCEDNSGLEIFEFRTDDKFLDYISLMGNKMIPYAFAVGEKYRYFISAHYKLIGNEKIQEGTLLNSSNDSLDLYDYHLSKNGIDCFKKLLECNRIHSNWLSMECGGMEEIIEEVIEEVFEEDVEEDDNIHELEYTDSMRYAMRL